MKLIDRLLSKVQPQKEFLAVAFITYDEESSLYKADCRLWGRSIISEHETQQEAQEAVDLIAEQYPGKHQPVCLIDDLTDDDVDENGVGYGFRFDGYYATHNLDGTPRSGDYALRAVMGELSNEQLHELAEGKPSDERIREIFDSTGCQMNLTGGDTIV